MKKITLLLIFAFMEVLTISASTADDKVYIRKFYTEYKIAIEYEEAQPLKPGIVPYDRSFSVIKKYCTDTFYQLMINEQVNNSGYDYLTDNYGIDALSLETLEIVSLSSGYLVSCNVNYETPIVKKKI